MERADPQHGRAHRRVRRGEAGPADHGPAGARHRCCRARSIALRALCGLQPDTGAALPDELSRRGAPPDVPVLPPGECACPDGCRVRHASGRRNGAGTPPGSPTGSWPGPPSWCAPTRFWASTTSSGAPSSPPPSTWSWGRDARCWCWRPPVARWGRFCPGSAWLFVGYAYYGGYLPSAGRRALRAATSTQIVDALYMGSGFYGTPLDVAATYIVLFTIYGAVLVYLGGQRVLRRSVRSPRSGGRRGGRPDRALAGFLLGTVSGSGAATTVSVGAVTWPILRRAGYPADGPAACWPRPGSARSCRRRRWAPPRSSSPSCWRSSYLQVLIWAASRPCCTTWASSWPSRSTPAGSGARPVERRRHLAVAVAGRVRLPLVLAGGHRAVPGVGLAPSARSSTPRSSRWPVVPRPPPPDRPARLLAALARGAWDPAGHGGVRGGGDHHRGRHQDRSWPQAASMLIGGARGPATTRRGGRAHRGVRRRGVGDARAGRAGHRLLHHRRGSSSGRP